MLGFSATMRTLMNDIATQFIPFKRSLRTACTFEERAAAGAKGQLPRVLYPSI
jgi:hypothetical protein